MTRSRPFLAILLLVSTLLAGCAVRVDTAPAATLRVATAVPATKEACKDGGWRELTTSDGRDFRNQGDCVSYVARD